MNFKIIFNILTKFYKFRCIFAICCPAKFLIRQTKRRRVNIEFVSKFKTAQSVIKRLRRIKTLPLCLQMCVASIMKSETKTKTKDHATLQVQSFWKNSRKKILNKPHSPMHHCNLIRIAKVSCKRLEIWKPC
jgi:hypothetical protein